MRVLINSFPEPSDELAKRLQKILGTITLLQHPLCASDIDQLLHLELDTVIITIMRLGSVLIVPAKTSCDPIRLLHPSFFDFLVDPARCTDSHFVVNPDEHHALLARMCLEAMRSLRRDICGIQGPSKLDSEVGDLSERIAQRIPPYVQYASRHWPYHLSCCRVSDVPTELLKEFCSNSLLHWVEICSLLGELRNALWLGRCV